MVESPRLRARPPLRPVRRWLLRGLVLAAVVLAPYLVTARQPAPELGMTLGGLRACPQSPNCVSTEFSHIVGANAARLFGQDPPPRPPHFVEPLEFNGDADADWNALVETVRHQSGVKIVQSTDRYLRAERSTTIYGLIDDVELLRFYDGTVLIRSAARIGYSDFGRNRRFVERIRAEFKPQSREVWF